METIYDDYLLRFPSREAAIAAGVNKGATDDETEQTAPYVDPGLNIAVLGIHSHRTGGTDVDPVIAEVPGWWVLLRVPHGFPAMATLNAMPEAIRPVIVARDAGNPAIPQQTWS